MNNLHDQLHIHELKVILMQVIIDLFDDQLTKEEAAIKISTILDYLSVETPALSFEQMTKNHGKEVGKFD